MNRLLTEVEVAEHLQVKPETVRYWRHIGQGPTAMKVGRFIRYRPEDVDAWLAARALTTPAATA